MTGRWIELANITISLLCFLVFAIYSLRKREKSYSNYLFILFLLLHVYVYSVATLIQNGFILSVPHLFRTGAIASFLFPPLVYLIIRKTIERETFRKTDLLHLIPTLLYVISYLPFFAMDAESKRSQIRFLGVSGSSMGLQQSAFVPDNLLQTLRFLQSIVYPIISLFYLHKTIGARGETFLRENRKTVILLLGLAATMLISAAPFLINIVKGPGQYRWLLSSAFSFINGLLLCIYLMLYSPEILFGIKGIWVSEPFIPEASPESSPIASMLQKQHYLSEQEVITLQEQITEYLQTHHPYLLAGYSIVHFSRDINVPINVISAYLNQHLKMNFQTFLNQYRIRHVIDLHEQNPTSIDNLTIEAIGQLAGFRSRSAFTAAFQKQTAQSPSMYFRESAD